MSTSEWTRLVVYRCRKLSKFQHILHTLAMIVVCPKSWCLYAKKSKKVDIAYRHQIFDRVFWGFLGPTECRPLGFSFGGGSEVGHGEGHSKLHPEEWNF